MVLFDKLERYSEQYRDRIAYKNVCEKDGDLTYGELKIYTDKMAEYLCNVLEDDGSPILVYGHKSFMMLVSFLACAKAHHPYCPIDISVPRKRIEDIIDLSSSNMMIAVEPCDIGDIRKLSYDESLKIINADIETANHYDISEEDIFYIIFTSGSTGKPKGVSITAGCLDNFLFWSSSLIQKGKKGEESNIFLNQALFSFDLSVMDIYTSLYRADTIWALDRKLFENMGSMFQQMEKSGVSVWVSTPSFVNWILQMNKRFDFAMLPDLHTFIFCGETLTNNTVMELQKRFPVSRIINTYGPTESTVAVTQIVVDKDMVKEKTTIPLGEVKPGSQIYILDEHYSLPEKQEGEKGEIVICGDTIAKGYFNQPDLTKEKFFRLQIPGGGGRERYMRIKLGI